MEKYNERKMGFIIQNISFICAKISKMYSKAVWCGCMSAYAYQQILNIKLDCLNYSISTLKDQLDEHERFKTQHYDPKDIHSVEYFKSGGQYDNYTWIYSDGMDLSLDEAKDILSEKEVELTHFKKFSITHNATKAFRYLCRKLSLE